MLFPRGLAGVIFDCDGVLLDSRGSNMLYYNAIRKHLGMPSLTREEEEYAHMHTARESLEHIVPPERLPDLDEACRKIHYLRDIVSAITPSPGVYACLSALVEARIPLAVHTNRTTQAETVLERFDLLRFFSIVMTASKAAPKPDPEGAQLILWEWDAKAADVLFVGDSVLDQEAARGAGTRFAAFANPGLEADIQARNFGELEGALSPYLKKRQDFS